MLIIITLALLALAGYKIQEHKNRDPWIGAVVGLVFGIIGVIVLLCLKPKPKAEVQA